MSEKYSKYDLHKESPHSFQNLLVFSLSLQDQQAQSQRQMVFHHTELHQDLLSQWGDDLLGTHCGFAAPATTKPSIVIPNNHQEYMHHISWAHHKLPEQIIETKILYFSAINLQFDKVDMKFH